MIGGFNVEPNFKWYQKIWIYPLIFIIYCLDFVICTVSDISDWIISKLK